MKNIFFIAILVSISSAAIQSGYKRGLIKYLGTNFLIKDGCPLPKCDSTSDDCVRTQNMIQNLYSHCLQSEDGQHLGCVTDKLAARSFITVPVYATVCSAMCNESPDEVTRIKKCPFAGEKDNTPELRHFND